MAPTNRDTEDLQESKTSIPDPSALGLRNQEQQEQTDDESTSSPGTSTTVRFAEEPVTTGEDLGQEPTENEALDDNAVQQAQDTIPSNIDTDNRPVPIPNTDSTAALSDGSLNVEQPGLTIIVEEPTEGPQEAQPHSGFSWSSNEDDQHADEDADDEEEGGEDEADKEDGDEDHADYKHDASPGSTEEGNVTAGLVQQDETPGSVQEGETRGRQQQRSLVPRTQSSSSRSVSPGSYQQYPAPVFSPTPVAEQQVNERPAGEMTYFGEVTAAAKGYNDDEDTIYHTRYVSANGNWELRTVPKNESGGPSLSDEEPYKQRKARYLAAGKGKPIYRSWAQSVQNASSPPNSPPKSERPGETVPDNTGPEVRNSDSIDKALSQSHLDDTAGQAVSSQTDPNADDPVARPRRNSMTPEQLAMLQNTSWSNTDEPVVNTDEHEPTEGQPALLLEEQDDTPHLEDEEYTLHESPGTVLFAPLRSGATFERPSSSHGPENNVSEVERPTTSHGQRDNDPEDERPTTPPRDEEDEERPLPEQPGSLAPQPISPTSPNRRGPEPLTGYTPEEGLHVYNEYRRSVRVVGSASDDSMAFLQKQRLMLKARMPNNRGVDAIETFVHNREGVRSADTIKEQKGMIDHLKANMLKYRWERNDSEQQLDMLNQHLEELNDRIRRREQEIDNLRATHQSVTQGWANAIESERQGREVDHAEWEAEMQRLQSLLTQSTSAVEKLVEEQRISGAKREELKAKCRERLQAREKEIAQWQEYARSNADLADLWRRSQDDRVDQGTQTAEPAGASIFAPERTKTEADGVSESPGLPPTPSATSLEATIEVELAAETPLPETPSESTTGTGSVKAEHEDKESSAKEAAPETSQAPEQDDIIWPVPERHLVVPHLREWIWKHTSNGRPDITEETINLILGDGRLSYDKFVATLAQANHRVRSREMARSLYDAGLIEAGVLPEPHESIIRAGEGLEDSDFTLLALAQRLRETERGFQAQIDKLTKEKAMDRTKYDEKLSYERANLRECVQAAEQMEEKIGDLSTQIDGEHGLRAALKESERQRLELEETLQVMTATVDEQASELAKTDDLAETDEQMQQRQQTTSQVDHLDAFVSERYEALEAEYEDIKKDYNARGEAIAALEIALAESRAQQSQPTTDRGQAEVPPTPTDPYSPNSLAHRSNNASHANNGFPSAMPTSDATRTPHIGSVSETPAERAAREDAEMMNELWQSPEYIEEERKSRVAREAKWAREDSKVEALHRELAKQMGKETLEYVPKEKRWEHLGL